jgi:superfamily II DNA helicase RecQ
MARTTDSKNGKRPKKSRRSDGRKRWFKSHTNVAITTSDDFEERIKQIPSLNLEDLQTIVQEAAAEPNVHLQMQVLILCLRLILKKMHPSQGREPKIQQVRTLRRLIFGKGDTILIAATGFGKSLILHAFSILTAKITLQIIPLNKLGAEQLDDIQKLGCTKPCLFNSDGRKSEKDLIARIRNGEFTHILLSPEQASSKEFRAALKDPLFQAKIGLVAIDELHLIKQWEEFRAKFTMLGELRDIMRQDVMSNKE